MLRSTCRLSTRWLSGWAPTVSDGADGWRGREQLAACGSSWRRLAKSSQTALQHAHTVATQLVHETALPSTRPLCVVGRIMLVGLLMAGTHPLAVLLAAGACWLLLAGQIYIIP